MFLIYSNCISQHLSEGIINCINHNDFPQPSSIHDYEYKIWFKDSCVIYERKMFISSETQYSDTTIINSDTYEVFKYTYLDLRNLHCQDYYNLNDTAKPFCNYFLKPDQIIVWQFYAEKKNQDITEKMIDIGDTVIQHQHFKRIKTVNKYGTSGDEYVFFQNCNNPLNIFHINKTLDEKFPHCPVTRSELIDSNSVVKVSFEFRIVESSLSDGQKKIFLNWGENAKKSYLPLLSYDEATANCRILPKSPIQKK